MQLPKLGITEALMIVDVQNDFCPGGALPVDEGDQTVSLINQWIAAAQNGGASIVASRDWHPSDHTSFREFGGPWPTHCVQGTRGAEFHPGLRLPADTIVVSKATDRNEENFSAFDGTGLAELLRKQGVLRIWVAGLALEYCVKATVLDALNAGFEVRLITDATRSLSPETGREAMNEMLAAGCLVEKGEDDA
jgi:nicotinamidase/pyrazinamidase